MNEIWIEFRTKVEQLLKPLGFKLCKKTFYRVVNDVLQTLMFQSIKGVVCTAHFSILDLAIGLNDIEWEQYNINDFREGKNRKKEWYLDDKDYNKISKNNEKIVPEMLEIITKIVIPLFERAQDSVTSLNELIKFSNEYELGETGVLYWDNAFYTYLKLGQYEKAIDLTADRIKKVPPNIYRKEAYIEKLETNLREVRFEYELSTIKGNFEKKRKEILEEENLSKAFISNAAIGGRYQSINQNSKDIINQRILRSIISIKERLETELEELQTEESEASRRREAKELKEDQYRARKIAELLEIIRLLSIPDRGYFDELIRNNEAISREYLKHPSKKVID